MSKDALLNQINDQFPSKAAAERAIEAVFGGVTALMRQRTPVAIRDFGTFKVVKRAARVARNPRTKETIHVAEKDVVKFDQKIAL